VIYLTVYKEYPDRETTMVSLRSSGRGWFLGTALGSAFSFLANAANAQITTDSTLPINSNVTVEGKTFHITEGTKVGRNLFHSFSEFSVPTGTTALFKNGLDIHNIINRVTGGSISHINGLIRANGAANLFLINPNGIIFGPNATLNVGGSFVATTADGINFDSQGFFSAKNPNSPALLTVNPSAFFFNQMKTAPIQNYSSLSAGLDLTGLEALGLHVKDGQSLLLVGGDIIMDGGKLNAFGGLVELGGLAGAGIVELNVDDTRLSLNFPNEVNKAKVVLSNDSVVNVRAGGGGSIAIHASHLDILGGSSLKAGIAPGLGAAGSSAGDIILNVTETITITDPSYIINNIDKKAIGDSGNIHITTGSLIVTSSAPDTLDTRSFGQGSAGNVIINARDRILLNRSTIVSNTEPESIGNSGDIRITTGSLKLTNGAVLYASTKAKGDGGDIIIHADDTVFVGTDSFVMTSVEQPNAIGKGGDIRISTGSLELIDGGRLLTDTSSIGNAGSIIINARDTVSLDSKTHLSSAIFNRVLPTGVGKGGDIRITTGSFRLSNKAELFSNTYGNGDAGSVIINARDTVSFNSGDGNFSSGVFNTVQENAIGSGGDIKITASSFLLKNKAGLYNSTSGQGDAGHVMIITRERVSLDNQSGIYSTVGENSTGKGGEISITTKDFSLTNSSFLNVSTTAQKNAGSVVISAETLSVSNQAQFIAETVGKGNAGKIHIDATEAVSLSGKDTFLRTNTKSTAQGGNITISTNTFRLSDGAILDAQTTSSGSGGNITVNSRTFEATNGGKIGVSSNGTGRGGNIEIKTGTLNLQNGVISAETRNSQGGDISIDIQDILFLRQGSHISTNAGIANLGGDGGNISIKAPHGFIIAIKQENSDITANAYQGKGGRVDIQALGIYGIEPGEKTTSVSDITASSQFGVDGSVELNTLNLDPNTGLVNLPSIPVNAEVAQGCNTPNYGLSRFVIKGRGGLPQTPYQLMIPDAVHVDWVSDIYSAIKPNTPTVSSQTTTPAPEPIVEATGWLITNKGEVILTAYPSNITPYSSWNPTVNLC
jgi:filamentous hemagglutinin family protein